MNSASGSNATVVGGASNTAGGDSSVAMGYRAKAARKGSFVFSDSTNASFASDFDNEFLVAAAGGIGLWTSKNFSSGCYIAAGGGAWSCTSSREVKRDFEDVDANAILDRVAALPISSWRYMNEPAHVRHLGPFAEDFRDAFGLGNDPRSITTSDEVGVALTAIKALRAEVQKLREKLDAANDALRRLDAARSSESPH